MVDVGVAETEIRAARTVGDQWTPRAFALVAAGRPGPQWQSLLSSLVESDEVLTAAAQVHRALDEADGVDDDALGVIVRNSRWAGAPRETDPNVERLAPRPGVA